MLDAEHDGRIHLDEAAIAIPGETVVAREAGETLDRFIVEAKVEHRIHHAGHGGAGAGAHRDEQRPFRIVEGVAGEAAGLFQRGVDLFGEGGWEAMAIGVEMGADSGGDREAGRHRQADGRHFGEIGPLAAEQLLH